MNEKIELRICRNKHGRSIAKSSNGLVFGRSPYGFRHLVCSATDGIWRRWKPKSLIRIGVVEV
jgi:hypothetical protein